VRLRYGKGEHESAKGLNHESKKGRKHESKRINGSQNGEINNLFILDLFVLSFFRVFVMKSSSIKKKSMVSQSN